MSRDEETTTPASPAAASPRSGDAPVSGDSGETNPSDEQQASIDHESTEHGAAEHDSTDQGSTEHDPTEDNSTDQDPTEHDPTEQNQRAASGESEARVGSEPDVNPEPPVAATPQAGAEGQSDAQQQTDAGAQTNAEAQNHAQHVEDAQREADESSEAQVPGVPDRQDEAESLVAGVAPAESRDPEEPAALVAESAPTVEESGPAAPAGSPGEVESAEAGAAESALDEALPRRGSAELKAIVEALVFASPDPISVKAIGKLLNGEPKEDVQAALAELKQDYERPGGLQLVEVAGGFQIVTRPDLHEWVRRLFHERSTQKLSVQALETLAVIAYRQPVTALEITEIRGVNTSGVVNTLLERHLIKIVGRKQVVGRPFMYATTKEFLIRFGLNDLADLPKVEDMAEALGIESSPLLIEQATADEQLPLDEPDDEPLVAGEDDPSTDGSSGAVH